MRCGPLSRSLASSAPVPAGAEWSTTPNQPPGLSAWCTSLRTPGTSFDSQEIVQHHERGCAIERVRFEAHLVERLVESHDVWQTIVREALVRGLPAEALVKEVGVLHVHLAGRADRASEHFGGVTTRAEQLEDRHARTHAEELQDLRVVAIVVARAIFRRPILTVDGSLNGWMNRWRFGGLHRRTRQHRAQQQHTHP